MGSRRRANSASTKGLSASAHGVAGRPAHSSRATYSEAWLAEVRHAPCAGSYLPSSPDPALARLLAWLEAHPDEPRTLAALARQVNSSERTLLRRAQRDLGMSLTEWRQRLCALQAMPRLAAGHTVEAVALALGYASASAFIVMFKQRMGVTPAEYAASAQHRK